MIFDRIARLASDRESGASEILLEALALLRLALASGADVPAVARGLVGAQPSMAPVWNAALAALASRHEPRLLDEFAERAARAPRALARFAVDLFAPDRFGPEARRPGSARGGRGPSEGPLNVVTLSRSGSVLGVLQAVRQARSVHVWCGEGRPAQEGRRLASELSASGIAVTCSTDAAIGVALDGADAVLVGADAVAADWFLNKVGTRMLAAAAAEQGVPVYVAASRDKFVAAAVAARLAVREGPPDEVWGNPPAGTTVRNPYFERTPLDLATGVITDAGVLDASLAREVCGALDRSTLQDAVGLL